MVYYEVFHILLLMCDETWKKRFSEETDPHGSMHVTTLVPSATEHTDLIYNFADLS